MIATAGGRRWVQIAAGWTVSLALVAGVGFGVAAGVGIKADRVALGSGSAWFGSDRSGVVALLDGSSGSRVTKVSVADAAHHLVVTQLGSSSVVVDQTAGTARLVDGRTFVASAPRVLSPKGDDRLRVFSDNGVVWAVVGSGRVVQELDPQTLQPRGAPHNLPDLVTGGVVTTDGALWVSWGSGSTGGLRSFAGGRQVASLSTTAGVLVSANAMPVLVEPEGRRARVLDPESGELGSDLCLDVDANPKTAGAGALVAQSSGRLPFVVIVDGAAGALVSSPCRTVLLSDPAAKQTPQWGEPVIRNGLVFVPDEASGTVVVVDPVAGRVLERVDIRAGGPGFQLLSHGGYVWFDDPAGDRAGVITDDLEVRAVSKSDGPADGEQPVDHSLDEPPKTPTVRCEATPPVAAVGTNVTLDAFSDDAADVPDTWKWTTDDGTPSATEGAQIHVTFASTGTKQVEVTGTTGGGNPRVALCPITIRNGDAPDATPPPTSPQVTAAPSANAPAAPSTTAKAGGGGPTTKPPAPAPEFTWSPLAPKVGQQVTFTFLAGTKKASSWKFQPDGNPSTSTAASPTVTFATIGDKTVILTDGAGRAIQHTVKIGRPDDLVVPNVIGKPVAEARALLTSAGLTVVSTTLTINALTAVGAVAATTPGPLSLAHPGTPVTLSVSTGFGAIATMGGTGVPGDGGPQGDGGPASAATIGYAVQPGFDAAGNLYFLEEGQCRIRRIDALTQIITSITKPGGCSVQAPGLTNIQYIAVMANGDVETTDNGSGDLAVIHPDGTVTRIAHPLTLNVGTHLASGPQGELYSYVSLQHKIRLAAGTGVGTIGNGTAGSSPDGTLAASAMIQTVIALTVAANGDVAFIDVDPISQKAFVHLVTAADKKISVIAGSGDMGPEGDGGPALLANFNFAGAGGALAFDGRGGLLLVDSGNNRVRRLDLATRIVSAYAGTGTPDYAGENVAAKDAHMNVPTGVAVAPNGTQIVTDSVNRRIRRIA